jgi:hypothetical protein
MLGGNKGSLFETSGILFSRILNAYGITVLIAGEGTKALLILSDSSLI